MTSRPCSPLPAARPGQARAGPAADSACPPGPARPFQPGGPPGCRSLTWRMSMNVLHRSRRLTWLAGCAALASGLAATAVAAAPAADAQARASGPGINRNAVVSWGSNNIGELGDGTFTSRSLYGGVSGLGSGIVQIAAGSSFGLALRSDGTVWAWGSNGAGQLGNGTVTSAQTTPVQVTGLSGVVAVAAGTDQSLALRSDGTVW